MSGSTLIDARGMRCPWPALRAARAMRDSTDVLVLADDPIAPGELAALAAQRGWQCSAVEDVRAPAFRLFAASH
ncbi:MAG: sulfurtransferase TusA family protein [Sphingobium sp.]|uniref:sulfurtransferase TusA family protein n=1 Tax=Sphingobium sp. TaxID=1912891 RepID=UPI0029ADF9CC|nr:sulfurtransferase TusA family protein [Sphingobium sp.]MDX3910097.1 sulfurtransferase TusA family protein [Sphingobium sp.]